MINDFIIKNEYQVIVCRKNISDCLMTKVEIIVIDDLRSAAFYAMGVVQSTKKRVLIIANVDDLSGLYTAATEAWFQKTPLHVLALLNDQSIIDPLYDRCFSKVIDFDANTKICNTYGPVLVKKNSDNNISKNRVDIYDLLNNTNVKNLSIVCSENIEIDDRTLNDFEVIRIDGDYGILSLYFGIISSGCDNMIGLCTANQLMLDINVFNNRYITDFSKIIVKGGISAISWIENNGFTIFDMKNIQEFWKCSKKALLIMEE
jgi:hypothetical protein